MAKKKFKALKPIDFNVIIHYTAMTTHSAQGQTFSKIIVHQSDLIESKKLYYGYDNRLIYTAMTRGKLIYKI